MVKRLATGLRSLRPEELRMLTNFAELALIQSTNLLLPLIVTPYLVRTVGADRVGVLAVSQAIVAFLTVLTDYGFHLTAVREVSVHRDDRRTLQTAWNEVTATKLLLLGLALALLAGVTEVIPDFRANRAVFIGGALLLLGQTLLPTWFFQGLEWMRPVTVLNAGAKLLAGVLVLVLVRAPADVALVNPLLSLGSLLPALVFLAWVPRRYGIQRAWPAFRAVGHRLRTGFPVFVSGLSVALYTNSNVLILRAFTNDTAVGYYSVIDKLITAIRQIGAVFFQVTYPRACQIAAEAGHQLRPFYRRYFLPLLLLNGFVALGLWVFDEPILTYFTGEINPLTRQVLHLLAWVPVVVSLNIPFYQSLLIGDHRYTYSGILSVGAVLCMALNAALAARFGAPGTAAAVLGAESFVTAALIWAVEVRYRELSLLRSQRFGGGKTP